LQNFAKKQALQREIPDLKKVQGRPRANWKNLVGKNKRDSPGKKLGQCQQTEFTG